MFYFLSLSSAFSDVLTWNCNGQKGTALKQIIWTLDLNDNSLKSNAKIKKKNYNKTNKIISKNNNHVEVKLENDDTGVWEFHYSGNDIYSLFKGEKITYGTCFGIGNEKALAKKSKAEMESMITKAKNTCKSLGFKEGTEKFADCSLKLYSQSVELADKNNAIVMQPQSSDSNVMTIYDPARNSNALMQEGMKMLSKNCTLGIDC